MSLLQLNIPSDGYPSSACVMVEAENPITKPKGNELSKCLSRIFEGLVPELALHTRSLSCERLDAMKGGFAGDLLSTIYHSAFQTSKSITIWGILHIQHLVIIHLQPRTQVVITRFPSYSSSTQFTSCSRTWRNISSASSAETPVN